MTAVTGGPAFPMPESRFPDGVLNQEAVYGMTKRDIFATKAMQGLLSQSGGSAFGSDLDVGARWAYQMADAMLKAREATA